LYLYYHIYSHKTGQANTDVKEYRDPKQIYRISTAHYKSKNVTRKANNKTSYAYKVI